MNYPIFMYSPNGKITREIKLIKASYILIKKNSTVLKFLIIFMSSILFLSCSKNSLKETLTYNYKTENSELNNSSFKYLPSEFKFLNEVVVKTKKRKINNTIYLATELFNSLKIERYYD